MLAALRRHVEEGGRIRLLTTTYTNSTEARALDELAAIGAEVKVSYDTTTTRLHAKAWLFHRHRGTTTAYIGSSNLTHSAHVTGLEWNVRVSGLRNPDVVAKMAAVFESYWESGDFLPYDPVVFRERTQDDDWRRRFDCRPPSFTSDRSRSGCSNRSQLARLRGHHRNLIVAATGTGKTVMAAVDFVRLRSRSAAIASALCGAPTGDPGAESRDVPTRPTGCEFRRVVGPPAPPGALRARVRFDSKSECRRARFARSAAL